MRRRPAFTLIEILVVVITLALLIGILLPALSHARESTRTLACTARLKQLVTLTVAYEAEYRFLPAPFNEQIGAPFAKALDIDPGLLVCPADRAGRETGAASYTYHPGEEAEDRRAWAVMNRRMQHEPGYVLFVDRERYHPGRPGIHTAYFDGEVRPWNGTDWIGQWGR